MTDLSAATVSTMVNLKVLPETEPAPNLTVTAAVETTPLESLVVAESVAPPKVVAPPLRTLPQPHGSSTPKKSHLSTVDGVLKATVREAFPLAAVPVATTV